MPGFLEGSMAEARYTTGAVRSSCETGCASRGGERGGTIGLRGSSTKHSGGGRGGRGGKLRLPGYRGPPRNNSARVVGPTPVFEGPDFPEPAASRFDLVWDDRPLQRGHAPALARAPIPVRPWARRGHHTHHRAEPSAGRAGPGPLAGEHPAHHQRVSEKSGPVIGC